MLMKKIVLSILTIICFQTAIWAQGLIFSPHESFNIDFVPVSGSSLDYLPSGFADYYNNALYSNILLTGIEFPSSAETPGLWTLQFGRNETGSFEPATDTTTNYANLPVLNEVTTQPAQDIVQSLESGQLYLEVCIGENVYDGLLVTVPEPSGGRLSLVAVILLVIFWVQKGHQTLNTSLEPTPTAP